MTGYQVLLKITHFCGTDYVGNYNHGVIYDRGKNTAAQRVWYGIAVAAFYTTRTAIILVGSAPGKIFIFRLVCNSEASSRRRQFSW